MEEILTEKPTIDSAAKNLLAFILGTISVSPGAENVPQTDRLVAQRILGSLLRNINSFVPSELQQDKIRHSLAKLRTNKLKVTKNSGRKMLISLWQYVEPLVLAECKEKGMEEALVKDVLTLFKDTLETGEKETDVSELVWAKDFNAVLRSRQDKRKNEISQRLEEMKKADEPQIEEITESS